MTKICIYGAGAIGGYLASALDQAGAEVSLVKKKGCPRTAFVLIGNPKLKKSGLRFEKDGQIFTHHLPASENPNEFGPRLCLYSRSKLTASPKLLKISFLYLDQKQP